MDSRKNSSVKKIGLGGSCHWCTEGIFRSIVGVVEVQQGWISATPPHHTLSEAIYLTYDPEGIDLSTLVGIHLHSHSCTKNHSMRQKYRSAFYVFEDTQAAEVALAIEKEQAAFDQPIITQVLPFKEFKLNQEEFLDYYYKNPEKPFCKNYIDPKLRSLLQRFSGILTISEPLIYIQQKSPLNNTQDELERRNQFSYSWHDSRPKGRENKRGMETAPHPGAISGYQTKRYRASF